MMTIATPTDFIELRKKVVVEVNRLIDLANKHYGLMLKYPSVLFDIRGTTGGTACYGKMQLRFNPTLLRENPDHYFSNTIPHEVAHLVARARYGGQIKPHGSEWQSVCWQLGGKAVRCHNMNVSHVPTRLGKTANPITLKSYQTELGKTTPFGIGKITDFD